jgi:hypothetical protein
MDEWIMNLLKLGACLVLGCLARPVSFDRLLFNVFSSAFIAPFMIE